MNEFQRAAFPAETQTGSVSVDRVSKTDTGHLFARHKTIRVPISARVRIDDSSRWSTDIYEGDVWASHGPGLVNPSNFSFGFSTRAGILSVNPTDRQGMANRYFAATAPDRNVGSVATTLVELMRGDIPSVLKNFREMMAGMKSIRNFLGSDYLNIAFGWTPLIQEYANLIKVGMNLERVVYYESFRRKRSWDGPSTSSTTENDISVNMLGSVYGTAYRFGNPGDTFGPSSGFGLGLYKAEQKVVESEDYHWSSRYTGLAKSGRKADSMSEQAMDVFKRLGAIDDPQMLWNLTPYSWLLDWFTTMGDSISNANVYSPIRGKYNVDYAYLTTQRIHSDTCTLVSPRYPSGASLKSIEWKKTVATALSQTRWRDRATPFGFGTQMASLSAGQFGILVALGLAQHR